MAAVRLGLSGLAALSSLGVAGCRCEKERPYTPFHIEPSAAAIAPSAAPSASAPSPDAVAPRPAAFAPPNVSEWVLDGVALGVDKGRVIEQAVTSDFDGDGKNDGVAWTRAREEPRESAVSGELVLFSGRAPAGRVIAKIPGFVPAGPGCRHGVVLTRTGKQTVALDVSARCDAKLVPRSPTRGISVVAPAADQPVRLVLRLADPAPGELMTFAVDSQDRDADGREDVELVASLRTTPTDPETRLSLVWIDRAAGLARDVSEPATSLSRAVSKDATREDGKNASRLTPVRVANARRLVSFLCGESGTARLFDADGQPLACGNLAGPMAELTAADVRAALQRRDTLGAVAALARDGWFAAPMPDRARVSLQKEVLALAPARVARETVVTPVPRAKSGLPRWSPLALESATSLLVETADRTVRVTLPGADGVEAADVDPWPVTVGAAPGGQWTGIALPCDRSEILLLGTSPDGSPLPPAPTALLAPRPGPCARGPVPTPALVPLEWTGVRHAGLVDGALFGAETLAELGPEIPRGSPRSPDGKTVVVPWTRGLLLTVGGRGETWTVDAPETLSDCVVANGATAVACVRGTRATVFTPEPAAAKKR